MQTLRSNYIVDPFWLGQLSSHVDTCSWARQVNCFRNSREEYKETDYSKNQFAEFVKEQKSFTYWDERVGATRIRIQMPISNPDQQWGISFNGTCIFPLATRHFVWVGSGTLGPNIDLCQQNNITKMERKLNKAFCTYRKASMTPFKVALSLSGITSTE